MDWFRVKGRLVLVMGVTPIAIAIAGCAQIQTTAGDIYSASHMQPLAIDPSSPVAADAARAEQTVGTVPSFASVPPKPTDIRSAAAYKSDVVGTIVERRDLARWEAAHPQMVAGTENYAETQRDKLAGMTAPAPNQDASADAFARKLREAAEAPPRKPPQKPGEKPAPDKASKATAPSAY